MQEGSKTGKDSGTQTWQNILELMRSWRAFSGTVACRQSKKSYLQDVLERKSHELDLRALTTEADAQASVHKKRQASLQTNSAKVTEWKALNYHSKGLLSSGTKVCFTSLNHFIWYSIQEGEELEKMLQEATGPWNASLQNVMRLKNEFHE